MTFRQPAAESSANLEYPPCPLCGSDRREFRFRLQQPYNVVYCTECGLCYLYPRLIESAMQEAYRQPSYYEGGVCGYADTSYTAQESALRATFKGLLHNLARRGLIGGDLLEIGCGYGYLLDEASSFFQRRVGTEFSPQGAEIAREAGAEVFVGGVEQISPDVFQGSRTCPLLRLLDVKLIDVSSWPERCSQASLSACFSIGFDHGQIRFQASALARALQCMGPCHYRCRLWKSHKRLTPKQGSHSFRSSCLSFVKARSCPAS